MGYVPLFTSAPRIKLYIGKNAIAYAVGFNINISIDVQPVQVIGKFGPASLEPTMYNPVAGTMQIMRLLSSSSMTNMKDRVQKAGITKEYVNQNIAISAGKDSDGKEIYNYENISSSVDEFSSNNPLSQNKIHLHLDPENVLVSQTFNMDLYMKVPNEAVVVKATDTTQGSAELSYPTKSVPWLRIKNVRVTSRNTNITLGQIVNEPVNFQGIMATPINGDACTELFTQDNGDVDGLAFVNIPPPPPEEEGE